MSCVELSEVFPKPLQHFKLLETCPLWEDCIAFHINDPYLKTSAFIFSMFSHWSCSEWTMISSAYDSPLVSTEPKDLAGCACTTVTWQWVHLSGNPSLHTITVHSLCHCSLNCDVLFQTESQRGRKTLCPANAELGNILVDLFIWSVGNFTALLSSASKSKTL